MESWTLDEMRAMRLPTTAWIVSDGQPARPVILRSVNAHRGANRGPGEETRASWVTEQARYASADITDGAALIVIDACDSRKTVKKAAAARAAALEAEAGTGEDHQDGGEGD